MALSEHLEKLRHFHRLCGFKSIREASMSIGISQAGLSKSIASLESVLEVQLFMRSREGLTLTKEGAEVFKAAQHILEEASAIETKLRSLKVSSTPAQLKIGMYDSIAVYFFPELKDYLDALYPNVRLELTVDTSGALAKLIQAEEIDIAIGVNLGKGIKNNLEFFKLFDDHYSFYASNRHDLSIDEMPILMHAKADDVVGVSVEEHLRPSLKKRNVHRVYNFETLKTLTSLGLGIGVLPTQVAKPLLKLGILRPIHLAKNKDIFGAHTIGFLATRRLMHSHRAFAEDIYRLGDRWSRS